jgi:iron complex outermembrane receptor protein
MDRLLVVSLAGLALLLSPDSGVAQEGGTIEEIIVTSQKRQESLQEVPISIRAYTGEELEGLDLDEIMDLGVRTPNMAFSRAGGEAQIYIRGIGTNIFGVGVDPSVGVHVDGVYLGRTHMALGQFLDVERIEILRGPQGTLYGRNTTGGAINILSRGPTEELEGYVSGLIGSFSRKEVTAAVGGPLGDSAGFRLAARIAQDDGFTDDLDPAGRNEIDDNDISQLRGMIDFAPSDRVSVRLIADYSDFDSGNRAIRPLDNLGAAEALGSLPLGDHDETRNNLDSFHVWDSSGLTADVEWDMSDDVTLNAIVAWREYDSDFLFNTDGTEVDITRSNFKYESEQFSTEIRLASNDDDAFQWILGIYLLEEEKFGALGLVRAGGRPFFATVPGSTGSFIIPEQNDTSAWAAFGEASWQLSDAWKFTLGLRFSDEEKDDFTTVGAVFDLLGLESPADPLIFSTRNTSDSWNDFTPKVGLEYRPSDQVMWYATVSQGFKSGGFNAFDANASFDQEDVTALEVGAKSDLLDGRLRLNGAAFWYDYEDLQVSTFINGLTLTTNAAEATILGAEADITYLAADNLELNLGVSLLRAKYDAFTDRQGNNPDGSPRVLNLTDNRLPNAPEFKVNASVSYMVDLPDGGTVELFGQFSHQAEVFYTQFNEPIVGEDGISLLDARVTWTLADGRWVVSLLGKNLNDEEYFQNVVRFTSTSDAIADPLGIGNALGYPAPGRSFAAQVTYRF